MAAMATTKLSSKGQLVIPRDMRESMHLEPGDLFAIYGRDDELHLRKIKLPGKEEFEAIMEQGREEARRLNITREDVVRAVREYRKAKNAHSG